MVHNLFITLICFKIWRGRVKFKMTLRRRKKNKVGHMATKTSITSYLLWQGRRGLLLQVSSPLTWLLALLIDWTPVVLFLRLFESFSSSSSVFSLYHLALYSATKQIYSLPSSCSPEILQHPYTHFSFCEIWFWLPQIYFFQCIHYLYWQWLLCGLSLTSYDFYIVLILLKSITF